MNFHCQIGLAFLTGLIPFFSVSQNNLHSIKNFEEKCGYANEEGIVVIPCQFDTCQDFKADVAVVGTLFSEHKYNWHWGLIGRTGNEILERKYKWVWNLDNNIAIANVLNTNTLYDLGGQPLLQCEECNMIYNSEFNKILITSLREKSNFKDSTSFYDLKGNFLVKYPGYYIQDIEIAMPFEKTEGRRKVQWYVLLQQNFNPETKAHSRWITFIDKSLNVLMDSLEGTTFQFTNNRMGVYRKGSWAVIDTMLREIIPFSYGYDAITIPTGGNIYCVGKGGNFGAITENNEKVIEFIYDGSLEYNSKYHTFLVFDKMHTSAKMILSSTGDTLVPDGYYFESDISTTNFNMPAAVKNKITYKSCLTNGKGGFLLPCEYDLIVSDNDREYIFFKGDSSGIISAEGTFAQLLNCKSISILNEGYRTCGYEETKINAAHFPGAQHRITTEGTTAFRYRYLDSIGNNLGKFTFDWAFPFYDGYAQVLDNAVSFMIDTSGNPVIIDLNYLLISNFESGLAVITDHFEKYGFVDKELKILFPAVYDEIEFDSKMVPNSLYSQGGYEGIPSYHSIPKIVNGKINVRKGDKWEELNISE